jgi:membrane fusion protein (multidrug efflux system)
MKYPIGLILIAVAVFGLFALRPAANAESESPAETVVAVKVAQIVKTTLYRYVMAYGVVEPEPAMAGKPAASSKLSAPVAGVVAQVFCEEGQVVKKGAVLFELDSRAADALVARAKVAVEFAQKNFARKQQLNAADNVSRKLYDEAEQLLQTARKDLANADTQRDLLTIKAPLDGTVAAIHFKAGEAIGLNNILADLIDLKRLDVALKIPSQEIGEIRLSQPVVFNPDSQTDQTSVSGQVVFISPQIDALTDTVLVRVSLADTSGVRTGQFVRARVRVTELRNRLAVPIQSVVHGDTGSTIAVVDGNRAIRMPVETGLRDGNRVEIAGDQLHEGMTVVTEGAYGLPDETRIRVIQ